MSLPIITTLGSIYNMSNLTLFQFQVLCVLNNADRLKSRDIAEILGMDSEIVTRKLSNWTLHNRQKGSPAFIESEIPTKGRDWAVGPFKLWKLTDLGRDAIQKAYDGTVVV